MYNLKEISVADLHNAWMVLYCENPLVSHIGGWSKFGLIYI